MHQERRDYNQATTNAVIGMRDAILAQMEEGTRQRQLQTETFLEFLREQLAIINQSIKDLAAQDGQLMGQMEQAAQPLQLGRPRGMIVWGNGTDKVRFENLIRSRRVAATRSHRNIRLQNPRA